MDDDHCIVCDVGFDKLLPWYRYRCHGGKDPVCLPCVASGVTTLPKWDARRCEQAWQQALKWADEGGRVG